MRRAPRASVVSEPFGTRGETVWASSEPRRMQTRKEVTEMHVAITRAGLALLMLAAVAAALLVLGIAPIETSTAMPPHCPPAC
jgi:hypothetical protein